MKNNKKLIAFILAIVVICCSLCVYCYAGDFDTDPIPLGTTTKKATTTQSTTEQSTTECYHCCEFQYYHDGEFYYECANCNETITKTADELLTVWNGCESDKYPYVNIDIRVAEEQGVEYLNVVKDNSINGKDYAYIKRCLNFS